MKGKKKNILYVSSFIQKCIENGVTSSDDILNLAKNKILKIDDKIKKIQSLKNKRSNLLDVVDTFSKNDFKIKDKNEIISLDLFNIPNIKMCSFICLSIKDNNKSINELLNDSSKEEVIFCIKNLVEKKIIHKIGETITKGDMYNSYIRFILKENLT